MKVNMWIQDGEIFFELEHFSEDFPEVGEIRLNMKISKQIKDLSQLEKIIILESISVVIGYAKKGEIEETSYLE